MNLASLKGLRHTLRAQTQYRTRRLPARRTTSAFSRHTAHTTIGRIYVINLDRAQERWAMVNRELARFHDQHGNPLSTLTRRFAAIDARHLQGPPPPALLEPTYTLAEQLLVDPHPHLDIDAAAHATRIAMTAQEVAIALSHIEVWKLIAEGDEPHVLVLEDDAYITRACMPLLERAWKELRADHTRGREVDLLYLSYQETRPAQRRRSRAVPALLAPTSGLWQLSGYVLSREAARKLVNRLPAHGPIDLWINLQFPDLTVRMTPRPVIEQRPGIASSNSYSVMPVLAKVGAIRREKPQLPRRQPLKHPVIVVGEPGSGLSAAATALSVLGLRCISDLTSLPAREREALLRKSRRRLFDAYVNIGSLHPSEVGRVLASTKARLIVTTPTAPAPRAHIRGPWAGLLSSLNSDRYLILAADDPDPWERLARFLGQDYPSHPWPRTPDQGQWHLTQCHRPPESLVRPQPRMAWDTSPWIIEHPAWSGLMRLPLTPAQETAAISRDNTLAAPQPLTVASWNAETMPAFNNTDWYLRNDTFPGNQALFRPANTTLHHPGPALLTLRHEPSRVRNLTAAAIATRRSYLYGTFAARLRVPSGSGLVSGLFLHRNGPRQEIDIEFLGRDTTRMLVNVFYNPGAPGTKLEYGYRGTPLLVDLGFDASENFHDYAIEWGPDCIRWRVDGTVVHERHLWDPTPIPDQPMEFNLNLWNSVSTEFAGPLPPHVLPATLEVASLEVRR
ncbi:family 16 glycosylhydrolase [Streptomyces sp. NPDC090109]|uniref:family 16 glycosylhydrolase n=1 Tax=Streptomyces sp. NPDC090109 TaxID=3365948 RepID=UPI0038249CE2